MKKTIITLAAFALCITGSAMAQGGYNGGYDRNPNQGGYNQAPAPNSGYQGGYNPYQNQPNPHVDDAQDWYRIERLDEIVNLSHHQMKELKRIEDRYDRLGLTPNGRLYPQDMQRLQWQKQQEVMSILDPIQRDRLYAFQQSRRGNRGGGYYGRRG